MAVACNPDPDETFAVLRERCEKSCAERDAALSCLRELLRHIDRKQFATGAQATAIWNAEALVGGT